MILRPTSKTLERFWTLLHIRPVHKKLENCSGSIVLVSCIVPLAKWDSVLDQRSELHAQIIQTTHQKYQYHCLNRVKRKCCISWRCWPLYLSSAGFLWLHIRRDLKRLKYSAWPSLLSVVSMAAWKGGEWVTDLNQCVYAGLIPTLRKTARLDMRPNL